MTGFTTVDLNWTGRPQSIAALLIESAGQSVVIDPGPASTLDTLRSTLENRGLDFRSLDSLLLTHIHLDHAGATGALVRENPGLQVYVHEFGATHMADPSRLLASAGRLYGGDLKPLYGECLPVPPENLRSLDGGEKLRIGEIELEVFYTPGHASHHVTFWDPASGTAFVGDTAGIRVEGQSFLLPATPPPDIELELWNRSLNLIASWEPQRIFLTHFGYIENPAEHIRLYREQLRNWASLTEELLESTEDLAVAERRFIEIVSSEVRSVLPAKAAEHYIFNGGLGLSWRGLARYIGKKSAGAGASAKPPGKC
jgi:glyoxylase-like metal-dependent hydrolase (beta-lactamase superfamily II)